MHESSSTLGITETQIAIVHRNFVIVHTFLALRSLTYLDERSKAVDHSLDCKSEAFKKPLQSSFGGFPFVVVKLKILEGS